MKTMNVFKALALAVITLVNLLNTQAMAQDNFITNEEVKNNLVVSRTIYKQDGNYLHNHMRTNSLMTNKTVLSIKQLPNGTVLLINGFLTSR